MQTEKTIGKRQQSNEQIIKTLEEVVKLHPELRFHQILQLTGVIKLEQEDGKKKVRDQFHEESLETLQRVQSNSKKLIN